MRAGAQGAVAGFVAGSMLGLAEIRVQSDLAHALRFLAAERFVSFLLGAVLVGIGVSAAAWVPLAAFGRVAGAARIVGAAASIALVTCLAAASVGPWRQVVFPMAGNGNPRLDGVVIGGVLATVALLLGLRLLETWRPRRTLVPTRVLVVVAAAVIALPATARLLWPLVADRRAGARPSVLLISLDTLRADRLGSYGYARPITPKLDALAAQGTLLERAIAPAPWTLPSHVSIFTSLLPFDHHTRWSWMRVPPARAMLAERFRDAGYRTAAFTGAAYVAGAYGFRQGFETYRDYDEEREGGIDAVLDPALRWLRETRGRPRFTFVHTYEPHTPYVHREFAREEDRGRLGAALTNVDVESMHDGVLDLTESERRYVSDLYDGDVACTDRRLGAFLDAAESQGLLENTIVLVLSDHGEEFWEHVPRHSAGHGHSLYQELIHVPWIIRAPGIPAGRRLRTPVSLIDVGPTLLDLAGLPPDGDHRGRSLAPALRSGSEPEVVPVFSESVEYGPDRFAVIDGRLKVIAVPFPERSHHGVRFDVRPLEIYDLDRDPEEARDLAGIPDPAAAALARLLVERAGSRLRGIAAEAGKADAPPEELVPQLKSLGYLR